MTNPTSTTKQGRRYRVVGRVALTTATAAAFVGLAAGSASAAPANTDSVVANVGVDSTITLNVATSSFDLNGTPLSTVPGVGAVTGLVTTNNATGYSVGVVAAAATLQPTGTNTDTIPIANLEVADSDGDYTPLSNDTAAPVITTTKPTRSALTGDAFSDDYRVTIPDVNSDTYSVTLDYTATALT
jgi:hypothetical protein